MNAPPPPPPGATIIITTQRRDYGGGLTRQQLQQRRVRIFVTLFFLSLGLSLALTFGLRGFSSNSTFPFYYFILPAILLVYILATMCVRASTARSDRLAAAPGPQMMVAPMGAPIGSSEPPPMYIPQAVPVNMSAPYPGATYPYATSLQLPPPQAGGASAACPRCSVANRTTALGCGHVFCANCAAMVATCPTCYAPVTARIRLY